MFQDMSTAAKRIKSKAGIKKSEDWIIKHFNLSNKYSICFKKSKQVILQLQMKIWSYNERQSLLRSIFQVVLRGRLTNQGVTFQFWMGKERGTSYYSWAQHLDELLKELACLISPSFKFQFRWKFDIRFNIRRSFFWWLLNFV